MSAIQKLILAFVLLLSFNYIKAQWPVTIPWSSSVNITFDTPLPAGNSDFTYSSSLAAAGSYTIIASSNDAGHVYNGAFTMNDYPPNGNKMVASFSAAQVGKDIFRDTVHNLCSNSKYMFWAGINNRTPGCTTPNLSFRVETVTGTLISSFQTGMIDGPLAQDNYSWYPGYYDRTKKPKVPFYGGIFTLPAGVTDIVLKIKVDPGGFGSCGYAELELDNILLTPKGPDVKIASHKYAGGWIAATCYQGNAPLELYSEIDTGYLNFPTGGNIVLDSYTNPKYQWQVSLDEGYTWNDIVGETNSTISHNFNLTDTFWVRLAVAEGNNIFNPNCRNVSNVLKIYVEAPPTNFSLTSNSPVCTDGDLKFEVHGGATYATYGPNGFYDDSPFPHIYHPSLADSGLYYTEVISFGGCISRDTVYVEVKGPPIGYVTPHRAICYGDTVHLSANGGLKYNWTPATALNNASLQNPIANPVTTTTYEVQVTDANGCSDYKKVTLKLRDSILKAKFIGPDIACPGDVIQFSDTSIGQIVKYHWSFGNGNTSDVKNPPTQIFPVTNGIYFPVTLTITDTAGCVQTYKQMLQSVNNCYIAVPSAFTPNGDGLNDYLYPLNAYKATDLTFQVFNRWGQKLFETKDWTKKWDGTSGGVQQATGVYIWMLQYKDEKKKPVFLKGTVALIR